MRDIKFRGMQINSKLERLCMIHGSDIIQSEGSVFIADNGSCAQYPIDKETLGQYTGLKDKNGIDIYEGDIVKVKYGKQVERGEVFYFNGGFRVKKETTHGNYHERLTYVSDNELPIEVVSNIYENPAILR